MQKEEKLELASDKVDKILCEHKKQKPVTKPKRRNKNVDISSIKKINDYFPTVSLR